MCTKFYLSVTSCIHLYTTCSIYMRDWSAYLSQFNCFVCYCKISKKIYIDFQQPLKFNICYSLRCRIVFLKRSFSPQLQEKYRSSKIRVSIAYTPYNTVK